VSVLLRYRIRARLLGMGRQELFNFHVKLDNVFRIFILLQSENNPQLSFIIQGTQRENLRKN